MARLDPHSFADDEHPNVTRIVLDLQVDFDRKSLFGVAALHLDRSANGEVDFDSRDLEIESVTDADGHPLTYELDVTDSVLGQRLRVQATGSVVCVTYRTSDKASALQWLDAAQTAGQRHPYVFTQCQAIHARSLFPCQDTPRVRVQYEARLRVPQALRVVMAAAHVERIEDRDDAMAIESFRMDQPIPTYLFAFAAGDIAAKEIGPRSIVYAEPEWVDRSAYEFADVEAMISTAESLFGPYDWERFDLLVMPPAFPYGGMENPRLTFLTPTVVAGDRSLVNIVAHELAHSWTGNLVTNASMNDFWLNEGFTTYAERRIIEALEGTEAVALHAAIGYEGLRSEVARFGSQSELTRLKTDLEGLDPDEVYSRVPYEKGYLFVLTLERALGREIFDAFLKRYIDKFRFSSITTADFLAFLYEQVEDIGERVDIDKWINGTGVPTDAPRSTSTRRDQALMVSQIFRYTNTIDSASTVGWTAQEWQIFLGGLATDTGVGPCRKLDNRFTLSTSGNAEIRVAFLAVAARAGDTLVYPQIRKTLTEFGRMKYLRPLYSTLMAGIPAGRVLARQVFEEARGRYHPVAAAMVQGLLDARDR